eukprot:TRINITY_DN15163_c0_g1_i1.p1 TRINITY_DN15163_c0_g1~~TRINITY_DN15163_c0_g1_i1.p1  ORF type:complete len:259 (+),score=32.69 TRINITY_DN15163_c0_g1_i1:55-777(+)
MSTADLLRDAKKLFERKSTYTSGIDAVRKLLPAEGEHVVLQEVVKRGYMILLSRHDDPQMWKLYTTFLKEVEEVASPPQLAKYKEWREHLERSIPEDKKEDREKKEPAAESNTTPHPISWDVLSEFMVDIDSHFSRNTPASREALHNLILYTIPHNAREDEYTCVVCQESLPPKTKVKKMPCGHLFHEACLYEWLKKNNTCPMCRHEIPKAQSFFDVLKKEIDIRESIINKNRDEDTMFS